MLEFKKMSKLSLSLIASSFLTLSVFAAQVPRPAEELTFKLPDGKEKRISDYKGKVVAVIFMSPTCPHCQQLTQAIRDLPAQYAPKGVQFVEIAFDAMASEIPGFNQKYQPPFPVGYAERNKIESFMQHSVMAPFMVPQMVIIDRHGVIQKQLPAGAPEFQKAPETLSPAIDSVLNSSGKKAEAPAQGARKSSVAAKKS
jgi:peroxiredoxin